MVYSSLLFIYIFLPVSLIVYYIAPQKLKELVMLLLSMVFCASFGVKYLIFVMLFTAVNYAGAGFTALFRKKLPQLKAIPFALGLIFDVSALFSFRTEMFSFLREPLKMPESFFPPGITLFTLSAIGYLIDVYKGKIRPERNFVRFSLFIMMFPRLLMGPILSYDSFLRITRNRRINMSRLGTGLTIFITGLAKKVLIADNLLMLYHAVKSSDVGRISALTAWLGIIAYMLCLYFTLSGISDMGVGIACCMGYRLPYSFSYPLFSSRIRYFAAKWHIQYIHWFRKYIIQPLTSVFRKRWLTAIIYIGAWVAAGALYGFTLSSAVWGLLMGTVITVERRLGGSKTLKATGIIYTFLATTIISVFLSEGSIMSALRYLFAMTGGNGALADQPGGYLFGAYILVILVSMYAATDLFRNATVRLNRTRFRVVTVIASPVIVILLLALCTALIAYTGSSETILIRL